MIKAFVTYLGTDSFLPGVLALSQSLNLFNKSTRLVVLVNREFVSRRSVEAIRKYKLIVKFVDNIPNPNIKNDLKGYEYTYTKLKIFEMFEYDKIIYLDADLLVCDNIENLFYKENMSAIISGALVNETWKDLNSGLMVVCPDKKLSESLVSSIYEISSNDGGDQGFLQSFFKNWVNEEHLHLHHRYNVPVCYLEEYCNYHDFTFNYINNRLDTNIAILHYWGINKPWRINSSTAEINKLSRQTQAVNLWHDIHNGVFKG